MWGTGPDPGCPPPCLAAPSRPEAWAPRRRDTGPGPASRASTSDSTRPADHKPAFPVVRLDSRPAAFLSSARAFFTASMASNVDFLVAFLLGILPGLVILWASLRRFDRPQVDHTLFDDRRVFGSLAVGLIFGTVASIFALALPRGDLVSFAVAVGVSFVFEESFKLAWLNRRSYRGRFDTTFYGVPLGIGAAASGVVAAAWASRDILYVPETFALLIVYSISLGLVNADTGALIGFGASRGNTWREFLRAIGVRLAHGAFLSPFLLQVDEPYGAISAVTRRVPVGDREEFGFPRQFDRGGPHTPSTVAGFRRHADDADVDVSGSAPAGRRTGPTVFLGATRELRTHLPDERCEFPRGLGSGTNARRGDMNLKTALTSRRLLLQIHAFRAVHRGQTTTPYICSDEKHERRKACAVVVHRDAQVLNPVVDPTELDPAELRHLPHLPLHSLPQRILGPMHVAFCDVPPEIIIAESVRDARGDRLALPPSLLREHAVGDRTHREIPPADGSDSHREDRGYRHDVLFRQARVLEGLIEGVQVRDFRHRLAGRDEEFRGKGQHGLCERAGLPEET